MGRVQAVASTARTCRLSRQFYTAAPPGLSLAFRGKGHCVGGAFSSLPRSPASALLFRESHDASIRLRGHAGQILSSDGLGTRSPARYRVSTLGGSGYSMDFVDRKRVQESTAGGTGELAALVGLLPPPDCLPHVCTEFRTRFGQASVPVHETAGEYEHGLRLHLRLRLRCGQQP